MRLWIADGNTTTLFYMIRYHMYLYQGAMVMQKQQTQTQPYREIHLGIFWIRGSKVLQGANRELGRVCFGVCGDGDSDCS